MHSRIISFVAKYNILRNEQNGFQKHKSTTLATFSLIRRITEFINNRVPTVGIFFDMSKAFDCVEHSKLLYKCEKLGIRGPALEWIESYLKNRKQCVEVSRINNKLELTYYRSPYLQNDYGVPQGSVLGPLLFILYINDLPSITNHQSILFADDISIVIPHTNKSQIYEQEINSTIESVISWLEDNNLRVNTNKTKYIQFGNHKSKPQKLDLRYKDERLVEVVDTQFLGVTIDRYVNWKLHVQKVCKKVNQFVYALRKLQNVAGPQAARIAYYGYVESVLRYGLLLWGNSTDANKAFLSQKKCIRALCNVGPLESCRPLFKEKRILTLTGLYILEICVFIKNNSNQFVTVQENNNSLAKRDPTRLLMPSCKTALYQRNCLIMCIKVYNKVPKNIREQPLRRMKKSLKQWLINTAFYNIKEFFNHKF